MPTSCTLQASGRDSALGSASMVGEGSSVFDVDESKEEEEEGKTVVSRSYSLPNQLANLGTTLGM